ncbi:MAG: PAS domain S-box protein, partial [Nitrospirae bacterium]|nr:PAS domain S-box protein [Nitrospirota bacterium]
MKRFSSLHSQIVLLLLAIMLPVLFILLYSANEQRQTAVKALKQKVTTDVRIISGLVEQKVEGARTLLIALAHSPTILNHDSASCSKFLADILRHNPQYTTLGAAGPDGNIFCSATPMPKPINASNFAWFQHALKSNAIAFGDYQIGRITGKPAIPIGYVARTKSGRAQVAVFVPFDLTRLSRLTEQVSLPHSTVFLIFDRNGKILSGSLDHEKWIGKTIQESELLKAILTQHEGSIETKDIDGIKRIYSFLPVAGTDNSIFISIGIPKNIALADFSRRFTIDLILFGLIAVLAFAAAFIISRLARQSEENLVKSTEQFQDLYDNAPNGYISVGTDGLIKRCNKQMTEMLGYGIEKLLGMPGLNLYADTPDSKEKAKKVFQRFLSGETIHGEELQMQKADGTLLWVSLNVNAIRDSQGRIMESRSIVQDITERRRADKALREKTETIQTIIQLSPLAIIATDSQGYVTLWNPAAEAIFGWSADETIGKQKPIVPPDKLDEERQVRQQISDGKSFVDFETQRIRKDGARIMVSFSATAFQQAETKTKWILSFIADITEHKQAEEGIRESREKIELILNSTAEGIYGLDEMGDCLFCNPACIQILGYHDEKDLLGNNMHDLIHHTKADGTSYPQDECLVHRVCKKGEHFHSDKEIFWRADRTSLQIEFWAYPILKDKKVTGTVVSFIDITDRKALENQFRQAQKMEAIGQLAAGVAHDFNNILSAIIGYGHVALMKMAEDDPQRLNIENMLEGADRAAHLTKDLLLFSRKQISERKPADLNEIIRKVEKFLKRVIGEDIECKTTLQDRPITVLADSNQLEQVLMNLA